jgi:hypothetical protein
MCPAVKGGSRPTRLMLVLTIPALASSQVAEVTTKENDAMQSAVIFAFVAITVAPLIGIWRGHVWAKANGLVLRSTATSKEQNLTA